MKLLSRITPNKIRTALALVIALTFTAVFSMSYFHEGSSISKYLCKEMELERVKDAEVQAYSDSVLFGDEQMKVSEGIDLSEEATSEQGFNDTQTIRNIDKSVILILFLLSWLMLIPQLNGIRYLAWIYLILAIYLVVLAFFKGINGGTQYAELAIPAQATRWLACVALWAWLFFKSNNELKRKAGPHFSVIWILLIGASVAFFIHGYEALNEHPKFQDLLYGGLELFSIPLNETACSILLKLIGIMDISLAIIVLFIYRRMPTLLLWMAFWGGITALSRPIAFGDVGWEDALLRVANCAVPFIIYLLIKTQKTHLNRESKSS